MSDNSVRTPGSGETIRTLDRSGTKTPMSLLDIARTGESELFGLADTRTLILTSAGLTTASTAYVAGDQLGTEMSHATAVRAAKGSSIVSGTLIDKAKLLSQVDLFVYAAATTPAADNAANAWSDADALNLLGILHFGDQVQSANNFMLSALNAPLALKPTSGVTLYFDLVTRTGHSFFGAVGDIQVTLGIVQD